MAKKQLLSKPTQRKYNFKAGQLVNQQISRTQGQAEGRVTPEL
jgi:hypothetical protein